MIDLGQMFKETSGIDTNRMLLSNSHKAVLATLNNICRDLSTVVDKAKKDLMVKADPILVEYVKKLSALVTKTKAGVKNLSNASLKKSKLFDMNKVLALLLGQEEEGLNGKVPVLMEVMHYVYGSKDAAETKYSSFKEKVESNFDLIDKGQTEKSKLDTAVGRILERPAKAILKSIGKTTGLGDILESAVSAFTEGSSGSYSESPRGESPRGGSPRGGSIFGSMCTFGGGSSGSRTSSKNGAGGAGNSIYDGLFEFFNVGAFQAKWTADIYTKVVGKSASGSMFGDLLGKFMPLLSGLLPVASMIAGAGISLIQGIGAIGRSQKENWFGNKLGEKQSFGQDIAAFFGGAIGGGKGLGEKGSTIGEVILNGVVGSIKGALVGFGVAGPFGALVGAFAGLGTALIGGKRVAIALNDVAGAIGSAFNWLVGMFKGVVEFFKNPIAGMSKYFEGRGKQTGESFNPFKESPLANVPNTEVAKSEASTQALNDMADRIVESNEKLSKGANTTTTSPNRSTSKSTGNPHMDYINMGLMGAPG